MKLVTMKCTQHDDTHHNDIENNGTLYNEINTQHNDAQHNDIQINVSQYNEIHSA